FEDAAGAWLDQRLASAAGAEGAAGGLETPGDALTRLLDQLTALKSRDEARVSEDSAQLVHLSALMNQISIAMLSLSMLLAVSIGVAFSRYLTGALRTLQSGAERIGSGDLSCRIDPVTQDELGSLARSFNEMTDKLARTMT